MPEADPSAVAAAPPVRRAAAAGVAAAAWGVAGNALPLLIAGGRLLRVAARVLPQGLVEAGDWAMAVPTVAVVVLGMGFHGLQRRFAPYVVARAFHLAHQAAPRRGWLAPLHAAGLVHATRARRVRTAVLFAVMGLLAALVRQAPEPHRATIRLGVGVGLVWGGVAILALAYRAARGRPPEVPLDLPEPVSPAPGAAR